MQKTGLSQQTTCVLQHSAGHDEQHDLDCLSLLREHLCEGSLPVHSEGMLYLRRDAHGVALLRELIETRVLRMHQTGGPRGRNTEESESGTVGSPAFCVECEEGSMYLLPLTGPTSCACCEDDFCEMLWCECCRILLSFDCWDIAMGLAHLPSARLNQTSRTGSTRSALASLLPVQARAGRCAAWPSSFFFAMLLSGC